MKTWFITGCSKGLGRELALAVLEKGDQAIVTARNLAHVEDIVKQFPETSFAVALDTSCEDSIPAAVEKSLEHFGKIDVLINNAGHGYRAAVEEGETEAVAELFQTNVFGPVELIKKVLPQMRERKAGAIINITSIAAVRSGIASGYYAASKAALELVSEGLYHEVKPLGIKVMIVEPGAMRTEFFDSSLKGTNVKISDYEETVGSRRPENLTERHNQPNDPAKCADLIIRTIEKDEYPRRLLLGEDAVKAVATALEKRMQEVQDWKAESVTTTFSE